jgi:hypothetical protein
MDGEAVFTHVPSVPGRPLNVGRALRVAMAMYRSRAEVQKRLGFSHYNRAISVPPIFQVRCLETDELFDPDLCNEVTARERQGSNISATRGVGRSGSNYRTPRCWRRSLGRSRKAAQRRAAYPLKRSRVPGGPYAEKAAAAGLRDARRVLRHLRRRLVLIGLPALLPVRCAADRPLRAPSYAAYRDALVKG